MLTSLVLWSLVLYHGFSHVSSGVPTTVQCLVTAVHPAGKPDNVVMIQCPNRPVQDFIELYPTEHVTEGEHINVYS